MFNKNCHCNIFSLGTPTPTVLLNYFCLISLLLTKSWFPRDYFSHLCQSLMVQAVIILLLFSNYSVKKMSLQTLKMHTYLSTSYLFMNKGRTLFQKIHQCYTQNHIAVIISSQRASDLPFPCAI